MAGERRAFSVTVTKDKSGSDSAQVPAGSASVDLYVEGATAAESKTITNFVPTSLAVYDIGELRVNDTVQVGTAGGTFLVSAIASHVSITALPLSGDVDVADLDRLVVTSRRPTLYAHDRGSNDTTGSGGTLTTNARGYAEAYLENANVDVIISGSGITTTLYRDRAAPQIQSLVVTEYGVLGDGSTNDATAISAAVQIAARSGAPLTEVVFPPGVYLIGSAITIPTGAGPLRLRGHPGAIIRPTTGGSPSELIRTIFTTEDLSIERLQFDNPANTTDLIAIGLASNSSTSGVTGRVTLRDCTFRDMTPSTTDAAIGILIGESGNASSTADHVKILDCHFEDIAGPAIKHQNGASLTIRGNTFDNVRRSVWSVPTDANYTLDGLKVSGNDMLDQKMAAIVIASTGTTSTYPHKDVKIQGNTIDAPNATSGEDGIYVDHIGSVRISGNTIQNAQGSAINVQSSIDTHIEGNTIVGADEIGIEIVRSAAGDQMAPARIAGNTIRDTQEEGIKCQDVQDTIVQGNVIRSWAQATGDIPAIEVDAQVATPDNTYIAFNHVSDNGGSGPGVRISAGCTDTVVALNYLLASTPVDDNATSGETQVFFNWDGTPGSTLNIPTSMDGATFRFAEGSVSLGGSTITIGDNGNYYEIDTAGPYDTVTPVLQAGTVIHLRVNIASSAVTLQEGGNINLGRVGSDGLTLEDEEGVALLSNGSIWIVVGTRDLWNYTTLNTALTTSAGVRSTSSSSDKAAFQAAGSKDASGGITDSVLSGIKLSPTYTSASGGAVTNHTYIALDTPALSGASPPTVTDGYVFTFNAAAGTHAAVDAGTTKTTPGGVDAWLKVSINGTEHYIPAYTSKTS